MGTRVDTFDKQPARSSPEPPRQPHTAGRAHTARARKRHRAHDPREARHNYMRGTQGQAIRLRMMRLPKCRLRHTAGSARPITVPNTDCLADQHDGCKRVRTCRLRREATRAHIACRLRRGCNGLSIFENSTASPDFPAHRNADYGTRARRGKGLPTRQRVRGLCKAHTHPTGHGLQAGQDRPRYGQTHPCICIAAPTRRDEVARTIRGRLRPTRTTVKSEPYRAGQCVHRKMPCKLRLGGVPNG